MATDPGDLVERLSAIAGRVACSDAERRAARLLAQELRAAGHRPRVETIWVRPAAGAVHAGLALLGVVASVLSVEHQRIAAVVLAIAVVGLVADLAGLHTPFRRLLAARATQNVLVTGKDDAGRIRLIVTAPLDVPRSALMGHGSLARAEGRLRRVFRGHLPGPHGVLAASLVALAVLTTLRANDSAGPALGLVQTVPTAILMLLAAGFAESAVAMAGPGANANASAAAVAVALYERATALGLRRLAVDLVLAGAGEPDALGMRHEVRRRKQAGADAQNVVVLSIAPCGAGSPVWWTRDGQLVALPYHADLVAMCERIARDAPQLGARALQTRRTSGARVARAARLPAIAVGCADPADVAPRAGQSDDAPQLIEPQSMAAALELCMALIGHIDEHLVGLAAKDAGAA